MTRLDVSPLSLLRFYRTADAPCSYLPGRQSASQVLVPPQLVGADMYSDFVRRGFRRSGDFIYRPACDECRACVTMRIPVGQFAPDRSQRRCMKAFSALQVCELPLDYEEEHYRLYLRYQTRRHPGGGMDGDDREQYSLSLLQSRVDTRLVEFREDGVLRMVSIIDVLDDGLSAVYAFFDPDASGAGLGSYNVLWQIERCRDHGLPYLYLGYWIRECRKMSYKARFQPAEGLIDGKWQIFNR